MGSSDPYIPSSFFLFKDSDMPSSSIKQYKLMMFAAMNADFAKKKGIDQKVAKEWHEADEKKKKEDPQWFYHLPDKFEKKKKEHTESMESLSSFFGKFFGSGASIKGTPQQVELNYVKKLFKDAHLLDEIVLKEGKIDTPNINHHLLLRHFNERTWLSDLENGVSQITNYAQQFFKARASYAGEMHTIYKKCETLEPKAALDYAVKATATAKRKLDAISPPKFILAIDTTKLEHGYRFVVGDLGQSPHYMNALTKGQVKKVLSLLPHLFRVDSDTFTDDEDDDLLWTLDDTDETKWWSNKYPDDDHVWGEMLNLFPCAGDFYEYEYEDELNGIVAKIRNGCEELINKSVKM